MGARGARGDRQERVVRGVLRHPEATIVGGVALLVLVGWALAFCQPWLRFIDREIHEPAPRGNVFATAGFRGAASSATGRVLLIELDDGTRVVRIEELVVENAPALRVFLSSSTGDGPEPFVDADTFDLGALRGNVGDMTYEIPGLVDLRRFRSITIASGRTGNVSAFAPLVF